MVIFLVDIGVLLRDNYKLQYTEHISIDSSDSERYNHIKKGCVLTNIFHIIS